MEQSNNKTGFKSHILLPVLCFLTLLVAIFLITVDDFANGLEPLIIWFYFGIVLAYLAVTIFDVIIDKSKSKKMKNYIIVMIALTLVSDILYAIFYILTRGK